MPGILRDVRGLTLRLPDRGPYAGLASLETQTNGLLTLPEAPQKPCRGRNADDLPAVADCKPDCWLG